MSFSSFYPSFHPDLKRYVRLSLAETFPNIRREETEEQARERARVCRYSARRLHEKCISTRPTILFIVPHGPPRGIHRILGRKSEGESRVVRTSFAFLRRTSTRPTTFSHRQPLHSPQSHDRNDRELSFIFISSRLFQSLTNEFFCSRLFKVK